MIRHPCSFPPTFFLVPDRPPHLKTQSSSPKEGWMFSNTTNDQEFSLGAQITAHNQTRHLWADFQRCWSKSNIYRAVWELQSIACKTSELWRNSDKIKWNLFPKKKKKIFFLTKRNRKYEGLVRQKSLLSAGPVFPLGSQRPQLWFEAGLSTSSPKTMPQFPITQSNEVTEYKAIVISSIHTLRKKPSRLQTATIHSFTLPCGEPFAATALQLRRKNPRAYERLDKSSRSSVVRI